MTARAERPPAGHAGFSNTLIGALVGILLVSVLGVLVMTTEYTSGMRCVAVSTDA
jgi:hypothetical protein